jgi:hypothetical protein
MPLRTLSERARTLMIGPCLGSPCYPGNRDLADIQQAIPGP